MSYYYCGSRYGSWWRRHYGGSYYSRSYGRHKPEDTAPDKSSDEDEEEGPLKVNSMDMKAKENSEKHHTNEYDQVDKGKLVARRGESFEFDVVFDRDIDAEEDEIILLMKTGPKPTPGSKGSSVTFKLKKDNPHLLDKPLKWCARAENINGKILTVKAQPPKDCVVGKWSVTIKTKRKDGSAQKKHKEDIFVLFNPWCSEAQEFMPDEIQRDECVLNDTGKIYSGNHKQIGSKPWAFAQFDECMLDCVLYLLTEELGLGEVTMKDPIRVCRKISQMVNSSDDNGIIEGKWGGDYFDCHGSRKPTSWTGSSTIIECYMKGAKEGNPKPVKYGQCWVFSGLVTSLTRAIGLGCRSVTNFGSAHDADATNTIDCFYTKDGDDVDKLDWDDDSVWNFHVWNELFCGRPDLPAGYGGWQAFDATPQETSEGLYQCGPASVLAVQQGFTHYPYETGFVFSEVNADRIDFYYDYAEASWSWKNRNKGIGYCVATKKPRKCPELLNMSRRDRMRSLGKNDPEMDDITRTNYKFEEGSDAERAAVRRAVRDGGYGGLNIYGTDKEDVACSLDFDDDIVVGSNFDIRLKMQNQSSSKKRNVKVKLKVLPCYYTGIAHGRQKSLKYFKFERAIDPLKEHVETFTFRYEDYCHSLVEGYSFRLEATVYCTETKNNHPLQEVFRLRRVDLDVTLPETCKVNEKIHGEVVLRNPLPDTLTDCEFDFCGASFQHIDDMKFRDIEPMETVKVSFECVVKHAGERTLSVAFESKQLCEINGAGVTDAS